MIKELSEKKLCIDFPVFGYKLNVVLTNSIDESRNKINHKVGVAKGDFNDCVGLHSQNEKDAEAFFKTYWRRQRNKCKRYSKNQIFHTGQRNLCC